MTIIDYILFVFLGFMLFISLILKIQDEFPFVRNYKSRKDDKKKYSLKMFSRQIQERHQNNALEGYFSIYFDEWEHNKLRFLEENFYSRKCIDNETNIITNILIYNVPDEKYKREFRVYYKFLDRIEIKSIVINNLGNLAIQYNDNSVVNYIYEILSKVEQDKLNYQEKNAFLSWLENMKEKTSLPANLVTLITATLQLLGKL